MELSGKTAFVTGGSGGLGRHLCAALAKAGADVAIAYRSGEDRAEATADIVRSLGRKARCFAMDQTDPASVDDAVAAVIGEFDALNILINNVGAARGIPPGDIEAFTPEIWDDLMAVNLRGPFLVARAAARHLKASGAGKIVNIGSMVGHRHEESGYAYSVSKAAVIPLTRYLASTLAPEICVNCVAPGLMEGTLMSSGASPEFVDSWRAKSVLRRTTSFDDVASQVVQFCRSDAVTGQTAVVDGGILFR